MLRIAWQALHNKEHNKIELRKVAGALFANDQQKQEHRSPASMCVSTMLVNNKLG
jgi:hypothetical protein